MPGFKTLKFKSYAKILLKYPRCFRNQSPCIQTPGIIFPEFFINDNFDTYTSNGKIQWKNGFKKEQKYTKEENIINLSFRKKSLKKESIFPQY